MNKIGCAIIGSGNIGVDLMVKLMRRSELLECRALVGIDPESDGLARARRMGIATTHEGIEGLRGMAEYVDIAIVFDATSAGAHAHHARILAEDGRQVIDLTPAAIGPYVVPAVNLEDRLENANINMVTCGGQATIPIVHAIRRCAPVRYAEIVASIASKSAGPGTRANIDEFTETTARALREVGGAAAAKAIIILNPAEPPLVMRDTVYCICDALDEDAVRSSVAEMVGQVSEYVPGYRLKQDVQFEPFEPGERHDDETPAEGVCVTVFLEVGGAGHYLPAYAGNLDIMTSAALQAAERLAELRGWADKRGAA